MVDACRRLWFKRFRAYASSYSRFVARALCDVHGLGIGATFFMV